MPVGTASSAQDVESAEDSDGSRFELVAALDDADDGAVARAVAAAAVPSFCTFIRDQSLADGATVYAGDIVTKTWIVRNTGDAAWPHGTEVHYSRLSR